MKLSELPPQVTFAVYIGSTHSLLKASSPEALIAAVKDHFDTDTSDIELT